MPQIEKSHYFRERSKKKYLGSHLNIAKMYRMYKTECEENNLEEAHIVKEWLYADIFNTEFNIFFKYPDLWPMLYFFNSAAGDTKPSGEEKFTKGIWSASAGSIK